MKNSGSDKIRLWEPDDFRKYRGKWNNKEEMKTMLDVRARLTDMRFSRQNTCPYQIVPSSSGNNRSSGRKNNRSTGSDYVEAWDRWNKAYLMYGANRTDAMNLKSPTTHAMVEAYVSEVINTNLGLIYTSTLEEEKQKARLYEHIDRALTNLHDWKSVDIQLSRSAAVFGTAISYNPFIRSIKEVEIILDDNEVGEKITNVIKEGDVDEATRIEELLNKKKPLTEKRKVITYEDPGYIQVSLYDFFVDENAWVLNGENRAAKDCIWLQTPSIDQFLLEYQYSTDPFVIKENVKRVKPAVEAYNDYVQDAPFFARPGDWSMNKQSVELLLYFNQITDRFIIVANDIIIRDGPLPYNHKILPFTVYKYLEVEGQFYGIGIPAQVERLQAVEEVLSNMSIESAIIRGTPPILATSDIFESVEAGWAYIGPRQLVEVPGDVSENSIRTLNMGSIDPGVERTMADIREKQTMASGINALQYSIPVDQPVRNNLIMVESAQKFIRKALFYFGLGKKDRARQVMELVKQFGPRIYEEVAEDENGGKRRQYKTIKLEGYKMDESLNEEMISGDSYIELKPEYLSINGDISVQLDTDSLVPVTRAVQVQTLDEALVKLVPILMNPQILQAPGVMDLIQEYVRFNGLPRQITQKLQMEDSTEEAIAAQVENDEMEQGKSVKAVPGSSYQHIMIHVAKLAEVLMKKQSDPMMNPEESMKLDEFIAKLAEHIEGDRQLGFQSADYTLQQAQALLQPPMPQQQMPMEDPMMAGMPPEMDPAMAAMMGGGMQQLNSNSAGAMPTI